MLIVDSQVHIWENAKMSSHHRQIPNYTKDDLLKEMDGAGVTAAIICPPASLYQVNDLAVEAAKAHPDRIAVMGWFQLDQPEARENVRSWMQRPGMVGYRWAMNQPHQKTWWQDGSMDWLWPEAERLGIPLAFLVTDNMAAFGKVAERHPGLKLMIDHLGRISGSKDDAGFASLPEMLALAKYPNVAVKVSGAPSNSSEAYPWRNIHPYIRQIFDAFGPDRTFWGTDITRLSCTWREAVTMFSEEMPWLKGRDLELVMGRGLCNWVGWKLQG